MNNYPGTDNYSTSSTWICTNDETVNSGDRCSVCGVPKPRGITCKSCGYTAQPGFVFCPKCGVRLSGSEGIIDGVALCTSEDMKEIQHDSKIIEGKKCYKENALQDAMRLFYDALEIDKTSSVAWDCLAKIYQTMNLLAKAEECYKKAIYYDQNDYISYLNYAVLQYKMRDYYVAAQMFEQAFSIADRTGRRNESNYGVLLRHAAKNYAKLGDIQRANICLRKAERFGSELCEQVKQALREDGIPI